jgi:hypothetical protein
MYSVLLWLRLLLPLHQVNKLWIGGTGEGVGEEGKKIDAQEGKKPVVEWQKN